jgi:fluoride exporter
LVLLFLAGGIGTLLRFAISKIWIFNVGSFPLGTFIVNILGCFIIGVVAAFAVKTNNNQWRLILATGFCGGFTTFSAFSLETLALLKNNNITIAISYIVLSFALGILATAIGFKCV